MWTENRVYGTLYAFLGGAALGFGVSQGRWGLAVVGVMALIFGATYIWTED